MAFWTVPIFVNLGLFDVAGAPPPPPPPSGVAASYEDEERKRRKRRRVVIDGKAYIINSPHELSALLSARKRGVVTEDEAALLVQATQDPQALPLLMQYLNQRVMFPVQPVPVVESPIRMEDFDL